jgi:hypothetical protein
MNDHASPNWLAGVVGMLPLLVGLWGMTMFLQRQVYGHLGLAIPSIPRLLVVAHLLGLVCVPVLAALVEFMALVFGTDALVEAVDSDDRLMPVMLPAGAYLFSSWGMGMLFVERIAGQAQQSPGSGLPHPGD